MTSIIAFLVIFLILVTVHEFGHFYFAKKSGILVREFAIGMGPKLFSKLGQDGVLYTIRMLPLGGYVRMAGLGEDKDVVEPGMSVGLVFNEEGIVTHINTTEQPLQGEVPVRIDQVDLTHQMVIDAIVLNETDIQQFHVARDARIIEPDGSSIQVAPYEVTYNAASPWGKFKTNIAGPMMNFLLAIIVFMIVGLSSPMGIPTSENVLGNLTEGGAAAQAGLMTGDKVVKIDEQAIMNFDDLIAYVSTHPNHEATFQVERQGQSQKIVVHIEGVKEEGQESLVGKIGAGRFYKTGIFDRLAYGFTETWGTITAVFGAIFSIFTRGFNLQSFGGPVAIAKVTGQAVSYGWLSTAIFLGMLSANLGAFNLLPIPALDGGKLVLNIIEGVRGKPLSQEKEGIITIIGALLLVIFMLAVTWNDIMGLLK